MNSYVLGRSFICSNYDFLFGYIQPFQVAMKFGLWVVFHQVLIVPSLHKHFDFKLDGALFMYQHLPQGFRNSLAEFLSASNITFQEIRAHPQIDSQLVTYLDDIALLSLD